MAIKYAKTFEQFKIERELGVSELNESMKDEYTNLFKKTLAELKVESLKDLTPEQKSNFFTGLKETWATKKAELLEMDAEEEEEGVEEEGEGVELDEASSAGKWLQAKLAKTVSTKLGNTLTANEKDMIKKTFPNAEFRTAAIPIMKKNVAYLEMNIGGKLFYFFKWTIPATKVSSYEIISGMKLKFKGFAPFAGFQSDVFKGEEDLKVLKPILDKFKSKYLSLVLKEEEILDENMTNEEMSAKQEEYQKFFRGKLEKYNVSSPSKLSEEDKKKFFNEIEKDWDKDTNEEIEYLTESESVEVHTFFDNLNNHITENGVITYKEIFEMFVNTELSENSMETIINIFENNSTDEVTELSTIDEAYMGNLGGNQYGSHSSSSSKPSSKTTVKKVKNKKPGGFMGKLFGKKKK